MSRLHATIHSACLLAFITSPSAATLKRPDAVVSLRIHPSAILLDGRESRRQLLVDGVRADGRIIDLTAISHISSPASGARVDNDGVVRPVRDGTYRLTVSARGLSAAVPVTVRNMSRPFQWSFANHVESVLSKQGCNMGACHGAAAGKGGFRLSLRAYDPDTDYVRLRIEGRGRRIVKTLPDLSLVLRKPSLTTSHVGGLRLSKDSLEYRVVREWIASGAAPPRSKDPHIQAVQVTPRERSMLPGASQQLQVTAIFSDGRREDVTHWARYSSTEESIAQVDPNGLVTTRGRGETAITVWYLGQVTFARLAVPFADTSADAKAVRAASAPPDPASQSALTSSIDRLIDSKLSRLALRPTRPCSDGEFVRRAFLDTIGTLPTIEETNAFLRDGSPNKRALLVDRLLERPEFVDFWAYRWADVLRINRDLIGSKGMAALYAWLRQGVAQNRPWDRIAYDLITASGPSAEHGPANFYRMGAKSEEFAETVSQTFLGIRVQCAHCHNHPFEKWTQSDYYRMANFFARIKRTEVNGQEVILAANTGDVEHPRLHRALAPAPFDGPTLSLEATGDRREFLASWVTAKGNPYFARTLVNRIWKQFMGRGLVEPVDDMRLTNPASNEPLLSALATSFANSGFDAKSLMKEILLSRAYQRSARFDSTNRQDDRFYSRYLPRRVPAEALLDAVCQVTGAPEKFSGIPSGTRAISLPDTRVASDFLDVFGRPARQVTCECERNAEPNMAQALHLITASTLNGKIASKEGTIARLTASGKTDAEIVGSLYLACFSRMPTTAERISVQAALQAAGGKNTEEIASARRQVLGDLLWALLSAPEFVYNH